MSNVKNIRWTDDALVIIDCRKLPMKEEYITCRDYNTLGKAIKTLAVKGAPAIGVAAAYGTVLAANEALEKTNDKKSFIEYIREGIKYLSQTRPTAVNLFWALKRMSEKLDSVKDLSETDIKKNCLMKQIKYLMRM